MLLSRTTLALALALGLVPQGIHAQTHRHDTAPWVEDVGIAAANALAGGLTAAASAWLRDEDVGRALLGGIVGGSVVFAGKRLVVEDFDGSGLLGRQVGALGASIVGNASRGAPWLDEVWLPVGPAWIQARRGSSVRVRVNAWSAGVLGWALLRDELTVDWGASARSGTFVFSASDHRLLQDGRWIGGFAVGGMAFVGPGERAARDVTLRHELVHVVQQDFAQLTWGRPLEGWGWSKLTDRALPVELGLIPPFLVSPLLSGLHEGEAETLEVR